MQHKLGKNSTMPAHNPDSIGVAKLTTDPKGRQTTDETKHADLTKQLDSIKASLAPKEPEAKVNATLTKQTFKQIDEPEEQSVSQATRYHAQAQQMDQTDDIETHEQPMDPPSAPQDIDPSIIEDTYNGTG